MLGGAWGIGIQKLDGASSDGDGDDGARDIGLGGDVIAASFGEGSG